MFGCHSVCLRSARMWELQGGGADCQCEGRMKDRKIQIGVSIEDAVIVIAAACRVSDPYAGLTHGLHHSTKTARMVVMVLGRTSNPCDLGP